MTLLEELEKLRDGFEECGQLGPYNALAGIIERQKTRAGNKIIRMCLTGHGF